MAQKISSFQAADDELIVLGLSTTLKDFRLAFYLNKQLNLNLLKQDSLPVTHSESEVCVLFSYYYWEESDNDLSICLVGNRSERGPLVANQKQTDYFLIIRGAISKATHSHFMKTIRGIPQVMACFDVNLNRNPLVDNMISDIELHSLQILQRSLDQGQAIKPRRRS